MIYSLLATEFVEAGAPIFRFGMQRGQPLLLYAPRLLEVPDDPCDPGNLWARAYLGSCGPVPLWPGDPHPEEYGQYEQPWMQRPFVSMFVHASRKGYGVVVVAERLRVDSLQRLVPMLYAMRDIETIERELPRLDYLGRLSVNWVYLVGFANPYNAPWTLFQATERALFHEVLSSSEGVGGFKIHRCYPSVRKPI